MEGDDAVSKSKVRMLCGVSVCPLVHHVCMYVRADDI